MAKTVVSDRKRILIFINIVISCVASSLLATALTTAMLPITEDLGVPVTTGQWLTSGYSLVMAIVMPLSAFLITRFRTKRLYAGAILIFVIGLLISGLSVNFAMMMFGRIVQACGGGMLTSMAQVIILSIFPAERKGTAMGWYGLSIGAAPVIAPTLAGLLVDSVGWRMIFFLSMIIMIISFVYCLFVMADVLDTEKKKFDISSFVMSALAFGGITFGIGNIGTYTVRSAMVLVPLIVGIVFAAIFSTRQLHLDKPFLDVGILRNRDYAVSVIGSMLLYLNVYGGTVILPLYVQQALGQSATIAGLLTLPGSLCAAVVSPFAGRIYDRLGIRVLFLAGSIGLLISNALMIPITVDTGLWVAIVLNIVRNVATSCLLMPLVTWGASTVSLEKTSHATALLTSLRTIAGSLGTAIWVAVMTITAANYGGDTDVPSPSMMHGVNMAFFGMMLTDIALLVMGLWSTSKRFRTEKPPDLEQNQAA